MLTYCTTVTNVSNVRQALRNVLGEVDEALTRVGSSAHFNPSADDATDTRMFATTDPKAAFVLRGALADAGIAYITEDGSTSTIVALRAA